MDDPSAWRLGGVLTTSHRRRYRSHMPRTFDRSFDATKATLSIQNDSFASCVVWV
jgi:hypothetical protein